MIRQAVIGDGADIMRALHETWRKNPNNQMKFVDVQKAQDKVADAIESGRLVIVDEEFAIMYDVGSPWYSSAKFLIEDMVLRIRPGSTPVRVAIQALDVLSESFGCVLTAVGDTQVGYMTQRYLDEGYKILGTQLIKER